METEIPTQLKKHILPDLFILFSATYHVSFTSFLFFPVSYIGILLSRIIKHTHLKYFLIIILLPIQSTFLKWLLFGIAFHSTTTSVCYFMYVNPLNLMIKVQMCSFLLSFLVSPNALINLVLIFFSFVLLKKYYEPPIYESRLSIGLLYHRLCILIGRTNYTLLSNECKIGIKNLYYEKEYAIFNFGLVMMFLIKDDFIKNVTIIGMILPFRKKNALILVFIFGFLMKTEIICVISSFFTNFVIFMEDYQFLTVFLQYFFYLVFRVLRLD